MKPPRDARARARRAFAAIALAGAVALASPGSAAMTPGPARQLPRGILAMPAGEMGPRHVLVAEKSTQTLYLYEFTRHRAALLRVYPCTTGKVTGDKQREGDLKTPEGVYWFCRRIPGEELPPLYGAGALVMDYPNAFDRRDGKTGSGIWLHGVETNDRVHVANDTRGCVAVRNDHFADLRRIVKLRDTPILIVETLELADAGELAREAHFIGDLIEGWRRAWESRDFSAYMSFYGDDFRVSGLDRDRWERHKRAIADLEGEREIAIDDISILREKDRVWATFRQEYVSATHQDVGVKTLYLKGSSDRWRIIGETWREVDEPFRILAPAGPPPQSLVASAAPRRPLLTQDEQEDALAEAASAELEQAAATAPPEGAESSLMMPPLETRQAASASASGDASGSAPGQAATSASETASKDTQELAAARELAAAPVSSAPVASAPVPEPATRPAPAAPAVAAAAARIAKGPFHLTTAWLRPDAGDLALSVQMLSNTPSTTRSGVIVLRLAEGGVEREVGRERFTVRQGRELEVRVPASNRSRVTVLILDEAGKVLLDQDFEITPAAAS